MAKILKQMNPIRILSEKQGAKRMVIMFMMKMYLMQGLQTVE